jgi:hypothetical protein
MAYKYEIFISYKRDDDLETLSWITQHFRPLLSLRVSQELGHDVSIFYDKQIESGSSWPNELLSKLSQSRVLVPLWSKNYFNSAWCVLELSHMLVREEASGLRSDHNSSGLLFLQLYTMGATFLP